MRWWSERPFRVDYENHPQGEGYGGLSPEAGGQTGSTSATKLSQNGQLWSFANSLKFVPRPSAGSTVGIDVDSFANRDYVTNTDPKSLDVLIVTVGTLARHEANFIANSKWARDVAILRHFVTVRFRPVPACNPVESTIPGTKSAWDAVRLPPAICGLRG